MGKTKGYKQRGTPFRKGNIWWKGKGNFNIQDWIYNFFNELQSTKARRGK